MAKSDFQVAVDLYLSLDKSEPMKEIAASTIRTVLAALAASANFQAMQVAQAITDAAPPTDTGAPE